MTDRELKNIIYRFIQEGMDIWEILFLLQGKSSEDTIISCYLQMKRLLES